VRPPTWVCTRCSPNPVELPSSLSSGLLVLPGTRKEESAEQFSQGCSKGGPTADYEPHRLQYTLSRPSMVRVLLAIQEPGASDKGSVALRFRPIDCFFPSLESTEFVVRMVFDYIILNGRPSPWVPKTLPIAIASFTHPHSGALGQRYITRSELLRQEKCSQEAGSFN
jgi:hypothetical protein